MFWRHEGSVFVAPEIQHGANVAHADVGQMPVRAVSTAAPVRAVFSASSSVQLPVRSVSTAAPVRALFSAGSSATASKPRKCPRRDRRRSSRPKTPGKDRFWDELDDTELQVTPLERYLTAGADCSPFAYQCARHC